MKAPFVFQLSRALSIYLFVWGCTELSYLPQRLYELSYLSKTFSSVVPDLMSDSQQFALHYREVDVFFLLVRTAMLFFACAALYRCGPAVRRYFASEADTDA